MPLHLDLATPEALLFSGEVDSVTLPGAEGEFGVWPGHTPLLAALRTGRLSCLVGKQEQAWKTGPGFAEVRGEGVIVLVASAEVSPPSSPGTAG